MLLAHPGKLIILGGFLVVFGLVVPLLMVLQVIPNSFLLSFISFGASFLGLIFGIIGSALYVREKHEIQKMAERDNWWDKKEDDQK